MPPDDPWLLAHRETVLPEWVDYNGHMNVAFYVLAFDRATDALMEHLEVGEVYRARTGGSIFVLEGHVTYLQEVNEGDGLTIRARILEAWPKRMRVFLEMYHAEAGFLAATNEIMAVHVDLNSRRTTPWPSAVAAALAQAVAASAATPWPTQAGRAVGMAPGYVPPPPEVPSAG